MTCPSCDKRYTLSSVSYTHLDVYKRQLYSFEYMKHEKRERFFFMFYTITYGITLGIAFSEDMLTMYFFYELLTLVTVPLVLHTLTREAILASRKYLYYSLGGAAFAFLGLIFLLTYGTDVYKRQFLYSLRASSAESGRYDRGIPACDFPCGH